jgi:hypothetical protein
MIIVRDDRLREEWRRHAKVTIAGAEGDHALQHSTAKRLNDSRAGVTAYAKPVLASWALPVHRTVNR